MIETRENKQFMIELKHGVNYGPFFQALVNKGVGFEIKVYDDSAQIFIPFRQRWCLTEYRQKAEAMIKHHLTQCEVNDGSNRL